MQCTLESSAYSQKNTIDQYSIHLCYFDTTKIINNASNNKTTCIAYIIYIKTNENISKDQ